MIHKAIALIVFFVLAGLAFGYWKGQTTWFGPWLPVAGSACILVVLITKWTAQPFQKTNSNRKTALIGGFVKWIAWFALTGYLLCSTVYYGAWRLGIIKYACMQPETASMSAHLNVVYHPMTGLAVEVAAVLVTLNLVLMLCNLRYGPRIGTKMRGWFALLVANPYMSLAVIACLVWVIASRLVAALRI